MITYSTNAVHPRDRSSYWRETIGKLLVCHKFDAIAPVQGSIEASELAGFSAARYTITQSTVVRSAPHIRQDGNDDYHFTLINAGQATFDQEGRLTECQPGGLVLLDVGNPITTHFRETIDATCMTIPRKLLEARLGAVSPHLNRFMSADSPVVRIVSAYMSAVIANHAELDETSAGRVHEQILDMVALAVSAHEPRGLSTAKATALSRLKAAITAGLADPNFSAQEACFRSGISARYANALLAEEQTSVERLIYRMRLERIRTALSDPAQYSRKVSEIAYAWGFSDSSHFTRRFRDAFGMTPREFRQAQLVGASPRNSS